MGAMAGGGVSLGALWVEINAQIDDAVRDFAEFGRKAGEMVDGVKEKFDQLGDVGDKLKSIGGSLSLGLTVPLTGLAAVALNAAGDLQSLEKALDTVTGSSEETGRQMARLKEIARLPGLGLEEAVKGSLALQNVGLEAQTAERYLKAFGNAIAAAGGGRADLEAVVVQLRQMGATGKVTAEDLKPILERVPQVAKVAKEAFGTISSEAISKAGISSQEFLSIVVAGLEKIPPVTGGIKNSFENLADSAKQSWAKIGQALIPVVEKAAPLLENLLTSVGDLAEWFMKLPAPVQGAALAVAGMAAAIGPLMLGLGGLLGVIGQLQVALPAIAAFFGTTVGGLAIWAAGIGVVVAALTALGVWVYQNWEPIVAVLKQAWEGIQELWTATWSAITGAVEAVWDGYVAMMHLMWDPVIAFFSAIWDFVGPYFTQAWEAVAGALAAVWNGIKSTAETVWNGLKATAETVWGAITGAVQKFLEWAAKIPGVAKLMNLDEVWASTKKAAEEMEKAADATKKVGDSAEKATPKIRIMSEEEKKAAKEAKKAAEKAAERYQKAQEEMLKRYDAELKKGKEFIKWLEESNRKIEQMDADLAKSKTQLALDYQKAHEQMRAETLKTVEVVKPAMDRIPPAIQEAIKKSGELETSFKNLGINSAAELGKQADQAATDYKRIMESGTASARDIDRAWVEAEEKRIAAARAFGTDIPAEQLKALNEMKAQLDTKLPEQKGVWENFGTQVSTVITNFAQDVSKSLWEGGTSWGEKGKELLKSLGQAVTSAFIEPATAAISGFITGAIKDLLGGEGLGGIFGSLTKIGDKFGDIFGKTGGIESAAGGVPGVGGAGGGAGGAGGAAAGAGLAGTIGAIGSVASAISGIIGNFQMAKMETTLNAIEESTRYLKIGLVTQADSLLNDSHIIRNEATDAAKNFWGVTVTYYQDWSTKLENLVTASQSCSGFLEHIKDNVMTEGGATLRHEQAMQVGREMLSAMERQINVTLQGSDPELVASRLAAYMRSQGVAV